MHSYHSYAQCKKYVEKYFRELRNGVISCYGHIPLVEIKVSLTRAFALLRGRWGAVHSHLLSPAFFLFSVLRHLCLPLMPLQLRRTIPLRLPPTNWYAVYVPRKPIWC
jgi:hypothetical protein